MAKQSGGLLAFNARGSIAKTLVFSRWRGRAYTRQHVIPRNPRSTAQVSNRTVFSTLMALWKALPDFAQLSFQTAALGRPITDRNLFARANLAMLEGQANLNGLVIESNAKGGLIPVADSVSSPVAGTITWTWTNPTLPTGWTQNACYIAAIRDSDPHAILYERFFSASGLGTATTISLTGLATGTYQVQVALKQTKADGTTVCFGTTPSQTQAVA